jgi:hypothetical protein
MKRMKRFPLVLAIAIGLAACTTDSTEVTTDRPEVAVPIVFTAVGDGDVTRAGTSLLSNLAGKSVNVYMQATKPGSPDPVAVPISGLTNDHAAFTVGSLSAGYYPLTNATTFYKPGAATSVSAYALYPTTAAPTSYGGSVSFSVNTAQNIDDNYVSSDLCHADAVTLTGTSTLTGTLAFHHLMAKVTVTVTNNESVEPITKVELLNVKPTLTFTPASYAFSGPSLTGLTAEGSATTITLYSGSITTGNSASCSCVIPPQTIAAGDFIRVTRASGTATYPLAAATSFYPGTDNTYAITVNIY